MHYGDEIIDIEVPQVECRGTIYTTTYSNVEFCYMVFTYDIGLYIRRASFTFQCG